MAFGTATVVTSVGKGIIAQRMFGATPSQAEPKYIGIGTGATGAARTAVAADTALTTGVETRATGTGSAVTTTTTNDAGALLVRKVLADRYLTNDGRKLCGHDRPIAERARGWVQKRVVRILRLKPTNSSFD